MEFRKYLVKFEIRFYFLVQILDKVFVRHFVQNICLRNRTAQKAILIEIKPWI